MEDLGIRRYVLNVLHYCAGIIQTASSPRLATPRLLTFKDEDIGDSLQSPEIMGLAMAGVN